MPWDDPVRDFRVVDFEKERLLPGLWISLLRHSVAGTTDLDELLDVDSGLLRRRLNRRFFGLLGSAPGQVALVLLSLRVGQVRSLVVVKGQAKLALIRPKMISHKVGVFLEVDGLSSQGGQSLAAVSAEGETNTQLATREQA